MNKNSNVYIITYATVMVLVVAVILASASTALKPLQTANVENEMKSAILQSIGEGMEAASAPDKTEYINEEYAKYITTSYVINPAGDIVEGEVTAFDLLSDLKAQYAKDAGERLLPLFIGKGKEGNTTYIIPVYGAGLWGPIWGYLALESDWNTIYGVVFDHQSETPGLGAEIATPAFENQFRGKTIFEGDRLVSVAVLKGAGSSAGNDHAVDAISGGTITSKAVESMLTRCLASYENFIEKERLGGPVEVIEADADEMGELGDTNIPDVTDGLPINHEDNE